MDMHTCKIIGYGQTVDKSDKIMKITKKSKKNVSKQKLLSDAKKIFDQMNYGRTKKSIQEISDSLKDSERLKSLKDAKMHLITISSEANTVRSGSQKKIQRVKVQEKINIRNFF